MVIDAFGPGFLHILYFELLELELPPAGSCVFCCAWCSKDDVKPDYDGYISIEHGPFYTSSNEWSWGLQHAQLDNFVQNAVRTGFLSFLVHLGRNRQSILMLCTRRCSFVFRCWKKTWFERTESSDEICFLKGNRPQWTRSRCVRSSFLS